MRDSTVMGWCAAVGATLLALGAALSMSCADTTATGPTPETAPPSEGVPAPAGGTGWAPGKPGLPARRGAAQAEIAEATRGLEVAGAACGDACPLLVNYRLGVDHLCSVADTKDDAKVCHDNRKALKEAETKLAPSCGTCGPHVEAPDASDYTGPQ